MNYRRLGRTDFEVSELGFGSWGIGKSMWVGAMDEVSLASLRFAVSRGVNFIDTALAYGGGHSEALVGKVARESSREVYIATKVPPKNGVWPARPGIGSEEVFPYDHVISSTETSLRNLGRETVDLQQLHVWNPEWLRQDEWKRALEDLKASGKARAVGISINDHQPDSALEVVGANVIDTVQVIYNVFDQTPERNLFPLCVKHDVGVIVRSPFDEGSLTGRIDSKTHFPEGDWRNRYFRDDRKKQVEEHVYAIVEDLGLEDMSQMAPVALRFCLSDPAIATVIPGMRSMSSVESNLQAATQGPLPSGALQVLRRHAWSRNFYD